MSEKTKRCVTGADPDEAFPVPHFSADFCAAPEIEAIATALIAACDEFSDVAWAIAEGALAISYVWQKKGARVDGTVRTGALAKTAGMVKHFAGAQYVIGLSADACYGRTNWQIEAEVWHQLRHINIGRKTVGKGDEKRTVPVLKKRSHDLEMFFGEVDRYGLWRSPLKQGSSHFAQAPLFEPEKPKHKRADGTTATITANGRTVDLYGDEADGLVREVVVDTVDLARRRNAAVTDRVNLVAAEA